MEKYINDKRIGNKWAMIKLSELPNDFPVLVVTDMRSKSLAEFHLAEYCIIPENLLDKIKSPSPNVLETDTDK
jgi:hypothetical protein